MNRAAMLCNSIYLKYGYMPSILNTGAGPMLQFAAQNNKTPSEIENLKAGHAYYNLIDIQSFKNDAEILEEALTIILRMRAAGAIE